MAAHPSQYQHYIPRFILKQFAHANADTNSQPSASDGLVHVFDVQHGEFRVGDVRKTCGEHDLYNRTDDNDPMRIEHLFSKLEAKTATVFRKIREAVSAGRDHIDVLEKDVHTLFKFMTLSNRRSQQDRDAISPPRRQNDFMFQSMFSAAKERGQSGEPHQFWLDHLLYMLESSHEDLLADADRATERAMAKVSATYKHFVEGYALQIWRAADGYEYFLNERLVDFEGDTQSLLGTERGSQLIWVTSEDMIHMILPIDPKIAVVFCDESRCWTSQLAEIMHRPKVLHPQNSLLKGAPHRDIVNVNVPSQQRRGKRWPATTAWRVSIGQLSQDQHRIIASYSLGHAKSLVMVRDVARFERARGELDAFSEERSEKWKEQGFRSDSATSDMSQKAADEKPIIDEEVITRMADNHISALQDMLSLIRVTPGPLPRTKDNAVMTWMAFHMLKTLKLEADYTGSSASRDETSLPNIVHPALRRALEAAYPAKPVGHRDLVELDFLGFLKMAVGDELFAHLMSAIHARASQLVKQDSFATHWEETAPQVRPVKQTVRPEMLSEATDANAASCESLLSSPSFRSACTMAREFELLKWMYEERQDILATFVEQFAVPLQSMQPSVIRMRSMRV